MLIKDVAQKYGDRVRIATEYYGASKLAEKYGLRRYPAVFVDDILLAGPGDFGWYGAVKSKGKYSPWIETSNHEKFKRDLSQMIDLVLKGDREGALKGEATAGDDTEVESLPSFSFKDVQGRPVESSALAGQIVVVEFWATWCPPCRQTLAWLADLRRRGKTNVTVIAVAVESSIADIKKAGGTLPASFHLIAGSGDEARLFGDLGSIPTMYVFDGNGKRAAAFYGATPDLHEKAGELLNSLRRASDAGSR